MSYVTQTLAPGEETLIRANFNWTYSFGPFFWFFLSLAPLIYVSFNNLVFGDSLGDPKWIYGLSSIPAVFGIGLIFAHLVHLQTTEIVVTTFRFVFKTGLISRETKEVSLNKIEEINLHQSIIGRIFGYGTLTLRGTGVGVIHLPDIDNPVSIRRTIEKAKAKLRDSDDRMRYHGDGATEPAPEPRVQAAPLMEKTETAQEPATFSASGGTISTTKGRKGNKKRGRGTPHDRLR